ncbi:MAG: DUF1289 domain-containing protein [Rhodoblastus sp.]
MSARKHAGAAQSPCTGVCRMDAASGFCEGCGRSLPEIADWGMMSDQARAQLRVQLGPRLADLRHGKSGSPENAQ